MCTVPFLQLILLDLIPPICSWDYWHGVFQNAIGCTIGSFAAIAVAYFIYWLSNQNTVVAKAQEAKDLLIYFKVTTQDIIQISKDQVEKISAYCKDIQTNDLELPPLRFLPLYNLKKIAEGDSMDRILIAYIRAFPGEQDARDFSNLVANVQYLYSQFLQFPDELRRTMDYDHERKQEFKRLFKNAFAVLREYLLHAEIADPTDLLNQIQGVMKEFGEHYADKASLSFFNQYFFIPLNDIANAELDFGDPDPEIVQLSHLTREGKNLFTEIKAQNQVSRMNMNEIIPGLSRGIERLESSASTLLAFT